MINTNLICIEKNNFNIFTMLYYSEIGINHEGDINKAISLTKEALNQEPMQLNFR